MTNPLIAKYEELYGKKEEPKPDYYKGEKSYAEELEEIEFPPEWSTTSVTTPTNINPNSVSAITAANPYPKLISYDTHPGNDSFLQIAEKVKNGDARVTSVIYDQDRVGVFSTGLTTITFEVQVWDTP